MIFMLVQSIFFFFVMNREEVDIENFGRLWLVNILMNLELVLSID